MLLLLLFHADGASGAFFGAYAAAFAVAVIYGNFNAVYNRFWAIYPAK